MESPAVKKAKSRLRSEMGRAIARERGGRLLSRRVSNSRAPLEWQCTRGHRWQAQLYSVKRMNWCPVCGGTAALTIEDMRRTAAERGGQCLSSEYLNGETPLQWQCAKHHVWWAKPVKIRAGSWCPACGEARSSNWKIYVRWRGSGVAC